MWCDGFFEMAIAPELSHQIFAAIGTCIPKSFSSPLIQSISVVVSATLRYYASVVERATMLCFLDPHDIKLEPKNTTYAP